MKRRIFRGASYLLLSLAVPGIGFGLKENVNFSQASVQQTLIKLPAENEGPLLTESAFIAESASAEDIFNEHVTELYDSAHLSASSLNYELFKKALTGYYHLQGEAKISSSKSILSIVDFTKPSSTKRMWIIDLAKHKLLFHTLVAHGRGSGGLMAERFSNTAESHQSSLGFYVTDDTYFGKHGLSLKLQGVDKGYNTNAMSRAIVVHGAEYVSQSFVNQNGYLGRSHGCPAVPVELTESIIKTIKGKTAMFLYAGSTPSRYKSAFLDVEKAADRFLSANQSLAKL